MYKISYETLKEFYNQIEKYIRMSLEEKLEKKELVLEIISKILIILENRNILYDNYVYKYSDYEFQNSYEADAACETAEMDEIHIHGVIEKCELFIKYVPSEIQTKYKKMIFYFLKKVKYKGFCYLNEDLKKERLDICKAAYLEDSDNIKFIPKNILDNYPELFYFERISDEDKSKNIELCRKAVRVKPEYIRFIPDEIKRMNLEICMEAVKQKPECIKYIPYDIKIQNMEMCVEAVKRNIKCIQYIPNEVKEKNIDICKLSIINEKHNIAYIPENVIRDNLDIYKLSNWNFEELPNSLKEDEEYLLRAVKEDYRSIKDLGYWVSYQYENNYHFYIEIIHKYENIFKIALSENIQAIQYIPIDILDQFEDILVKNLKNKDKALEIIGEDFDEIIDYIMFSFENEYGKCKQLFQNPNFVKELLMYFSNHENELMEHKELLNCIPYNMQYKYLELKIGLAKKIGEEYFYYRERNIKGIFQRNYNLIKKVLIEKKEELMDIFNDKLEFVISYIPSEILINNSELVKELIIYILENENILKWHKNILKYIPHEIQNKYSDLVFKLYKKVGNQYFFDLSEKIMKEHREECIEICKYDWHNFIKLSANIQHEIAKEVLCYFVKNEHIVEQGDKILQEIEPEIQDENEELIVQLYDKIKTFNSMAWLYVSDNIKEKHEEICLEFCKNHRSYIGELGKDILEKIAPRLLRYFIKIADEFKCTDYHCGEIEKLILRKFPAEIQEQNEELIIELYKKIGARHYKDLSYKLKEGHEELYIEACKEYIEYFNNSIFNKPDYFYLENGFDIWRQGQIRLSKIVFTDNNGYKEYENLFKEGEEKEREAYDKWKKEMIKQKNIARELLIYFSENEESLYENYNYNLLRMMPKVVQDENEELILDIYKKLKAKYGKINFEEYLSDNIKKRL